MTRLFAALLALEARAQLFAILAAVAFIATGQPVAALIAAALFLSHDLLSYRLRRR